VPNLLYRWRPLLLNGGAVAVSEDDDVTSNRAVRQLEERKRVCRIMKTHNLLLARRYT